MIKSTYADSADMLWKTISGLSSGQIYTIYVYAMTTGGSVSQDAARLDVTVSKCLHSYVLFVFSAALRLLSIHVFVKYVFLLIYCAWWCTINQWKPLCCSYVDTAQYNDKYLVQRSTVAFIFVFDICIKIWQDLSRLPSMAKTQVAVNKEAIGLSRVQHV